MTLVRPIRNLFALGLIGALVLGCGAAASASPATAPPQPSAAPSQIASGAGLVLTRTGPVGCDAIGVDYTSATIKIDAASDPDVWAVTDAGKKLALKWTDGFTATDGTPPVINGPKGEEVARDGTKITVPGDTNPRLAGYFVCLGSDAVLVLETDPQ
jgi:hypothetical protein